MYKNLFIQEVNRYWQLNKLPVNTSPTYSDKLRLANAIQILQKKSELDNQSLQFLVSAYAYFYSDVFKIKSFKYAHLRISEFLEKIDLEKLPLFTNDDVELAYKVRTIWNSMNHTTSGDIPFRIRKQLSLKKCAIGRNTFFRLSNNFVYFVQIANFVNRNKLSFPEIHGLSEFFLHLPILYGPKEYQLISYIAPMGTVEKYYKKLYSTLPSALRYPKILEGARQNSLDVSTSNMWCSSKLKHDLALITV